MGSWRIVIAGAMLLGAANAAISLAEPVDVPRTYMVEFVDDYDVASFYSKLGEEDIPASSRLNLTYTLFKGASFELGAASGATESLPNRIAKLPMVRKIWPVQTGRVPEDETLWAGSIDTMGHTIQRRQVFQGEEGEEPATGFSPHIMTQVDKLKAEGITGKGIKIGIVDTGVDYTHPALGGCFGEGCLVAYGRDYVGDYYDEGSAQAAKPDDDPYDGCNGHGTHIAGIIAAQKNPLGFSGVAPGVTLGAYRVSSCRGFVHTDIYIAAFNQAFEDGSDIITTSTQFASEWSEDSVAVVFQRITEAGVPCVAPMGNSGLSGLFSTGSPAVGHGVTAVASAMNLDYPLLLKKATYTLGDETKSHTFGYQPGKFGDFKTGVRELWLLDDEETGDCTKLPEGTPNLANYVVLISLEGCSPYDKTSMIMDLAGRNVMAYSNNFTTYELHVFPLAVTGLGMVPKEVGLEWVAALKEGKKVTISTQPVSTSEDVVYNPKNTISRGYIGTTSSWGLGLELDIKPQFAAPGGNILSTNPLRMGGYAVKSGTSMASPFAAGVYALLAEARGTTDPAELTNLLASTANANQWFDGKELHGILAPVPQQGAGLLQAYAAAHTKTLLDTSGISFNDTDNFIPEAEFTIRNTNGEEVTYALGHVRAVTVYASEADSFRLAPFPNPTASVGASLAFSEDSVAVPAGESVTIKVTPTPPSPEEIDAGRLAVYSGYVTVNGTNGDALSVPYVGVAGSMRSVPIFDPAPEASFLQYWDAAHRLTPVAANTTYIFPEPEGEPTSNPSRKVPYVSSVFARPAGTAVLDVLIEDLGGGGEGAEGKILGSVPGYPQTFVPHGTAEIAFTGMLANGTVVAEGTYGFVFRALKILGDREEEADYDTMRLGPFVLEYGDAAVGPVDPFPFPGDF
ncbi:related to subtilisin-like serine protease [Cephalotrichum gorgonifer]|uniref:Related to subtilisin-like serine protease n=1 Tax=Cephalotrichum gorgonifer TaxID=2041049 RepID=A0AAE8N5K1_9PEZI|nr:related to subtilisin-like serine protease [Cephalotrichum gorgonifer]